MKWIICVSLLVANTVAACIQGAGDAYFAMRRSTGPEPVDFALLRDTWGAKPESRLEEFADWYIAAMASASDNERRWLEREHAAIRHILTGNYDEAIAMLLAMESDYPGQYAVASTLGTAYELAGDNRRALLWITEGMSRDPESHGGTEWLHVKILEAKIAMESDPTYLASHPIVPYPPESEPGLMLVDGVQDDTPDAEVMDALFYQLKERMLFVKPEDPVVGDLLYSFSRLEQDRGSESGQAGLLKLARAYGHETARAEMPTLATRSVGFAQSPGFLAGLVFVGLGMVLLRKLRSW